MKLPKNPVWDTLYPTTAIYLNEMSREQIQVALQWCIAHHCHSTIGEFIKDGLSTQEWEVLFVAKLLDPAVK